MSTTRKNKNTLFVLGALAGICVPFLTSCGLFVEEDKNITYSNVEFSNLSDEFTCNSTSMKLYFHNDGALPYVDVLSFVATLDGVIDVPIFRYRFDINTSTLNLMRYYSNQTYSLVKFDWKINAIYGNNSCFDGILKSTSQTNYSSYLKSVDYYHYGEDKIALYLGYYFLDILYSNGKCFVPLVVANLLFCSQNGYNVFYNGDKLYGYFGELSTNDTNYDLIRNSSKNGQTIPFDLSAYNEKSLELIFDYFYGLKSYKKYNHFFDYMSSENRINYQSRDPVVSYKGLNDIVYNQLDELHTRVNIPSMYAPKNINVDINHGERRESYYARKNTQSSLRQSRFPNGVPAVRYYGDTAIITFDSFKTGSNSQIYNSDGSIKSDAWKYDTYFFMRYCMNDISKHSEIEDVVIDISLNSGGNIGAMIRALGFLTDETIDYSTLDTLTEEYHTTNYVVDTDGNGRYNDDSYSQYNWNVLVGENSFSAANTFTSIVLQEGLATVIGQKSGGGMCSVMSVALADGTGISISSNNSVRYVKNENGKKVFRQIESGLNPNYTLDYNDFYNDSAIVNLVDAAK